MQKNSKHAILKFCSVKNLSLFLDFKVHDFLFFEMFINVSKYILNNFNSEYLESSLIQKFSFPHTKLLIIFGSKI